MKRIRFKKTKGSNRDYEKFKQLFNKLGIVLVVVDELEINLNFLDLEDDE